jgi:hypothetical protein
MIWRGFCPTPPALLASCEIADSLPNKSFAPDFTVVDYWQDFTVVTYWQNCQKIWLRFQQQGRKEYTVHTFSWLLLSFAAESLASGSQSGKAPYRSLPLPHLGLLWLMRSSRVVRASGCQSQTKSQQSWVRSKHPPTQWNTEGRQMRLCWITFIKN